MSTSPVPSLIDEQLAEIERSFAVLGFGMPVFEVLGLPRDTPVRSLTRRVACTFKGRRVALRVRP